MKLININIAVLSCSISLGFLSPSFAQDKPATKVPGGLSSKKGSGKIFPANSKLIQVAGHDGYLALPEGVKPGEKTPWLWYCPSDYKLPGKLEQWMMKQCLDNGIAVAGIDVRGDFGTPAGRKIFTAFHKELTEKHRLTKKVCLLARSYGGTQMYNWAVEHPEWVACLAGIYPVCNLASYPGMKSAAGKYKMPLEEFTKVLIKHNPIDRLAPLAKAKVPIYHNTGDIDTLVPPKDNSFLVQSRYKALGGDITVTIFKGQGHNYWTGFFEDKAMAAFIIKHAKKSAGLAKLPKVLFFGDSISGGYSKSLIKLLDGKADVTKLGSVAGYRIGKTGRTRRPMLDFGNALFCIEDIDRFTQHLEETKYDVIHFNFGLNDIFRGRNGAWHSSPEKYAEHLSKIVALLKTNGAKIIWANTTPIPANAPHMPVGDDLIYNVAAEKVMKKNNIPINDLHSVVTKWDGYEEWKKGNDVHFGGGVYSKLAEQIAKKITIALVEHPAARPRSFGSMQKSLESSKVLTYKTVGQRKLNLHIFHPEGFKVSDRRPAYVVFHGGGWRSGTPRRFYPYAASLVPDGFVGISAEYRLTGRTTTVFDCVKDGRAAIRYIRRHAKDLGIDPDRITVGGGSAGGHVALGTALFDTVEHADEDLSVSCKPNALVLLFSVLDTSPEGYGNKVIGAEWRTISPLHQIRPKMPPTLIFHGDKDSVAPYPTLMAFYKKMQDSKNVCELVLERGGVHGHINNDMKLFDDAANRTRTFLSKQQLGPSGPQKGTQADSNPKVLIIGDSISGGYSKPLIKLLDGKAELTKLGAVAGYRIQKETFWHSRGAAKYLDFGSAKACIVDFERFEKHLETTPYDVIHFNFGLNDIFRGRNGAWHNPVDQYAKDLAKIVTLLKKTGAKVIWANTTPIPANAPHNPEGDEIIYNAAAEKVMKKHGIPINDLHSVVTNWDGYAQWKKGNDVHFPGAVYSKLAAQISEKILAELEATTEK